MEYKLNKYPCHIVMGKLEGLVILDDAEKDKKMSRIYEHYSQEELQDLVEKLEDCLCTQQIKIDDAENLLLLALYHHQGFHSIIGQPIRKYFGMGTTENMQEWQIERAESVRLIREDLR